MLSAFLDSEQGLRVGTEPGGGRGTVLPLLFPMTHGQRAKESEATQTISPQTPACHHLCLLGLDGIWYQGHLSARVSVPAKSS